MIRRGACIKQELDEFREAGLFKQERFIHSPQAADIEVEFPSGADLKKVINICANNYLGLSSHPEVIKAAHEGLDTRGYGMSSVRFICGTQDIHRELGDGSSPNFWAPRTRSSSPPAWMPTPVCLRRS